VSDVTTTVPSGGRATSIIARLTLRRLFRGNVIWVALVLIAVPVAFAAFAVTGDDKGPEGWKRTFLFAQLILAIVPPVMLASTVGEEIEKLTYTYLWSRPIPRWSVISGKLLALLPIVLVILCGALAASFPLAYGSVEGGDYTPLIKGVCAIALGGFAVGCLAIGIGSLSTRFGLAISIMAVFVLDIPLGNMEFSLQNLSITHHVRQIASVDKVSDPIGPAIVWLAGIAAFWLALAVWRIGRAEYATKK
jgi:ABC-type transport system involved in multi-copper enzyme maturation permease subunit